MSAPGQDGEGRPLRIMPWWLAGLGLLAAIGFGWLVTVWLLGEADRGTTRAELRIDAIRTGLTVVAGTGAGVALLIAARRQWLGERAQRHREQVATQNRQHQDRVQAHQEQVAATNQRHEEHDATERRITDLYTKAVELLGSDRPAVRLGGQHRATAGGAVLHSGTGPSRFRRAVPGRRLGPARWCRRCGDNPGPAGVRGATSHLNSWM